jgi:hypothetical protein
LQQDKSYDQIQAKLKGSSTNLSDWNWPVNPPVTPAKASTSDQRHFYLLRFFHLSFLLLSFARNRWPMYSCTWLKNSFLQIFSFQGRVKVPSCFANK